MIKTFGDEMDKMINLCGTLCNNLVTLRTTENPEGWDVKNLSLFEKEIVPISLNPYFLEAPLVARMTF